MRNRGKDTDFEAKSVSYITYQKACVLYQIVFD